MNSGKKSEDYVTVGDREIRSWRELKEELNKPNPLIPATCSDIETTKWGTIVANEDTGLTTKPKVYAGGDIVTGAATVILAMGAGKIAAKAIDEMLRS